jgi:hypothetical protein
MIPKIIHYCWLSNNPIPDKFKEYIKTWKEKLPDYDFILWNLKRFDINTSIWVKQSFEAKSYAYAADYIRLYAIYKCGGIYLDMDMEVLKSFDDMLNQNIMMAFENQEKNGIEAGCFGAEKNNKFISACLEYYENREFTKPVIPLPKIMYDIYIKTNETFFLYGNDYFTAKSYQTGSIHTTIHTFTIHHFAGSWISKEQKRYDTVRIKLYGRFGNRMGKVVSFIPFFRWQIMDNGIKGVWGKLIRKLK